jgi:peptidyl-dipeptidase Dcp
VLVAAVGQQPDAVVVVAYQRDRARLYSYLWSDVMAADVAEQFLHSRGGLHDAATGQAWNDRVLSVGHSVPANTAFRALTAR